MHIGILITNTDESAFAKRHPRDPEKFRALLQPLRPDWTFTPVLVKDGVFPAGVHDFEGYVIGGSPASVHDGEAWIERLLAFIREIDAARVPAVGACFGHQAIAMALGGEVGKNPGGWGFGLAQTEFPMSERWMVPERRTLELYAAHNEQVTRLPARGIVLGGSLFCPVGSYKIDDHIFTTQYHPEMTPGFIAALVEELADYVGPAVAGRACEQIKNPAEGSVFAEWALRFLEMPR